MFPDFQNESVDKSDAAYGEPWQQPPVQEQGQEEEAE
jgi:hypothetical protein